MRTLTYASAAASLVALSPAAFADTEFDFGGYIKFDALTTTTDSGSLGANNIGRDFYIPSLTPVLGAGAPSDSNTYTDFHARQSRLWLKSAHTFDDGTTIQGHVEIDFIATPNGDKRISNSYTPRLRHAFFKYQNWTVGQTWSNFQDLAILPESVDFIGVTAGTVFNRQPQIRYTAGNGFAFSVEQPESTVTPYLGGTSRITTGDSAMPDLTLSYRHSGERVHYGIAAIARQIEYQDTASGVDSSETGFGVNLTTKIKFGQNDVRIGLVTGSGLGRYVGLNATNGAVLNAQNDLEAIDLTAYSFAYRHVWSSQVSTNLVFSRIDIDDHTASTGAAASESMQRVAANVMYSINERLRVGAELSRASRETYNGGEGNLDRLQLSAQYSF
ncbi:DcaP family trimeric outer membrane transporter [Lysobacter sp. N42]|uniref:DcaP family trimeric outer membrane transporter n=1 Tax=Lysobacter sp. N42 TaxID=2545719 RepID=UPI001A9CD3E3|nr:DcaP family trimeric outer membrane transporter [Lysobacter sp. N42]